MKTPWSLYTIKEIANCCNHTGVKINGKWVPARPLRYISWVNDLKLAWLVFTRKADAFTWPENQ